MSANPFRYGKEVSGYQFYDRTSSCDQLYCTLKDGSTNVVLYAPRRYGKTSLALKVLQRFKAEGVKGLHFDLSKVNSLEKFCSDYTAAVYALWGGLPEIVTKIREYLVHLHPTISFSEGFLPEITFDYGERMNSLAVSEVLNLPEKLAESSGDAAVVIALDEFQDVADLTKDVPMEAVIRSVIQSHRRVRYVFLGSKTHLMMRMFCSRSRPFYKSALGMKIGKPPEEESREFVVSRFAAEGIEVPEPVMTRMLELSQNIPYFLQAMAALSFQSVVGRGARRVDDADVDSAVERFTEGSEDYYDEVLRNLADAQRPLLEALAREPTDRFGEDYRIRHRLGSLSTVHSAIRGLMRRGVIDSVKGVYAMDDPFFARYVRMRRAVTVLTASTDDVFKRQQHSKEYCEE